MRISDHPDHTWERGNFVRSALRVTTSDDDARVGVSTMNFSHGVARLRVCCSCDGASVEDDEIGRTVIIDGGEPACEQAVAKRGGISLRCAASKIFNAKRSHRGTGVSTRKERTRRLYQRSVVASNSSGRTRSEGKF